MSELLLAVDAGNTNTVLGLFRGDDLVDRFRLSTDVSRTADEIGALVVPLLGRAGVEASDIDAAVVASVVPPLNVTLQRFFARYVGREPLFVGPGVRTGLPLRYEVPAEIGADRIVNALAARERYGAPVVVVDFGTATTFDVVNAAGEYAGGIIAPGLGISAEALFSRASRLYKVDVAKPERLVGTTTAGAMQSGLYYGYIALVDGILDRLAVELEGAAIVATGGDAELIAPGSRHVREIDPDLTLTGLKLIHDRNR